MEERKRCSFCGRERDGGRELIAGAGACICSDCVALCNEILAGKKQKDTLGSDQPRTEDR